MSADKIYLQSSGETLEETERRYDVLPAAGASLSEVSFNKLCLRLTQDAARRRFLPDDNKSSEKMLRAYRDYAIVYRKGNGSNNSEII